MRVTFKNGAEDTMNMSITVDEACENLFGEIMLDDLVEFENIPRGEPQYIVRGKVIGFDAYPNYVITVDVKTCGDQKCAIKNDSNSRCTKIHRVLTVKRDVPDCTGFWVDRNKAVWGCDMRGGKKELFGSIYRFDLSCPKVVESAKNVLAPFYFVGSGIVLAKALGFEEEEESKITSDYPNRTGVWEDKRGNPWLCTVNKVPRNTIGVPWDYQMGLSERCYTSAGLINGHIEHFFATESTSQDSLRAQFGSYAPFTLIEEYGNNTESND